MRVIARRTLQSFWATRKDSEQALKSWFQIVRKAAWKAPADVKAAFPKASIVGGNRVIFNIVGGKYRLVVRFHYNTGIAYIRFIGTHAAYDQIDVENI